MDFREQLKARYQDKLKADFDKNNFDILLATSSNDEGVVRNGGRRGAAHGANAILSQFKNLISPESKQKLHHCEVFEQCDSFELSQQRQVTLFETLYKDKYYPTFHLGGGHDHVYPFVKSLQQSIDLKRTLHILNIDAHLDTRQDQLIHSGTPFRQLASELKDQLTISQFGIHPYANTKANYEKLNCTMNVYHKDETNIELFQNVLRENSDDWFILSLDTDGIDAMTMEAVSAVNHDGLKSELVTKMFEFYFQTVPKNEWAIGIYEYNPLFDNLSSKGSRYLASLLYRGITIFNS